MKRSFSFLFSGQKSYYFRSCVEISVAVVIVAWIMHGNFGQSNRTQ